MNLLCTTYHAHQFGITSFLKNKFFTTCLVLISILSWQNNLSAQQNCSYTLNLFDSFGDGWNGSILTITIDGVSTDYTIVDDCINDDGFFATFDIDVIEGLPIELNYQIGGFQNEVTYELIDPSGNIVFADGPNPALGIVYTEAAVCPDCPALDEDLITFTDITSSSATMNWMELDEAMTYTIEWGLQGFAVGMGTVETTAANFLDFSGLMENTLYDVYIFANCSMENGEPIGPITFQTGFINPPGMCTYTLELNDTGFGNQGWDGSFVEITINNVSTQYTLNCLENSGISETFEIPVLNGFNIQVSYTQVGFNGFAHEYTLYDADELPIFSAGPNPLGGVVYDETVICPDCPILDDEFINFEDITFNGATMNWMGIDSALSYTLEWGLEGFIYGDGTVENTTEDFFTFSGLEENTLYDVYIFTNCSGGVGQPIGPFTFQTGFVDPPGMCNFTLQLNDTGYGNVGWDGSFVSITINNITTIYTLDGINDNGVSETFTVPVLAGFDIVVGYTQVGFNGFNHNYTLFDSDGLPLYSAGPNPEEGTEVFTTAGFCPDCPAASPPSAFIADMLTDTTAMLTWENVDIGMSYIIEYGPTGFPLGAGLTTTSATNSVVLTGLNPCVTYDAYVTVDCGGEGLSTTVGPVTFTTTFSAPPNNCPIILDGFMQDVNANNATVEWIGDDNSTANYIVEYGTLGFTLGTGISATLSNSVSSFQMNNLEENTWYNVYITTDCGVDTSKTFGPISFQTLWLNDVGVGVITNPTDESCNLSANETVTIGLTNFGQNPQSLFEYFFAVNGQIAPVSPPNDGFFTGVVGNDSTLLVDFETTWDFSVPGFYVIEAWTNMEGDSDSSNDTLRIEIVTAFPLPLMEDFEEGEVPEGWITDEAFGIYDDGAHGNVTTVLGDNMFSGDQNFEIITPRFGPINDGDSLSFDYRYTVWSAGTVGQVIGQNIMEVQVSDDCMETWTTIFTVDDSNHTTSADATTRFVDLSAYAGSALNIRFFATWASGDYWLDMDNINILGCPPNLGLMADINNPTIGTGNNGSIALDPMFGTPPYDFDWNTNDNTSTINDLSAGEYLVTVTDANGCQDVRGYVLEETVNTSEIEAIQNLVLSPNPTTGLATLNMQLNRTVDVDIQIFNVTGQVIESISQSQINALSQDFNLTNQAAGMYFVRIMIEGQSHYERLVLTK